MGTTEPATPDTSAYTSSATRCRLLSVAREMTPVERRVLHELVASSVTHVQATRTINGMGYQIGLSTLQRHRSALCLCGPESLEPKHLAAWDKADKAEKEARAKRQYEQHAANSRDKLLAPTGNGTHRDKKAGPRNDHHPVGWAPTIKYTAGRADEFIAPPTTEVIDNPDTVTELVTSLGGPTLPSGWRWTLVESRYDPVAWTRTEQGSDALTKPAWRYRFKVVEAPATLSTVDMEELVKLARNRRIPPVTIARTGSCLVVGLADWQAGQADGDGLIGLIGRLDAIPNQVRNELARLRRAGTPIDSILYVSVGDLVENCDGYYATMQATVQAHRRGQSNVVRRTLINILTDGAALGLPVDVLVVGGNHGEHRKDGKSFMGDGDNDDVAIFETVHDAFQLAGEKYSHVTFHIPDDALSATLDVKGVILGVTHGHLSGGGPTPEKRVENWLKAQALARTPIGEADLVLTGHFHTWRIGDLCGVRWVQLPALCDSSKHFTDRYGMTSTGPALLTFTISEDGPDHWRMHQVKYTDMVPEQRSEAGDRTVA